MGPERTIENKLRKDTILRGGKCLKLQSEAGTPDRIVLLPGGKVGFVETKRDESETPRRLQLERHRELRRLGFPVFILNSKDDIKTVLDKIENAL